MAVDGREMDKIYISIFITNRRRERQGEEEERESGKVRRPKFFLLSPSLLVVISR